MRETRAQLPVKVATYDGRTTSGEITLIRWDRPARMKRAIKTLGYFWAGGLFSIILPGLHFILVPGLLLAGPLAAWWLFDQESVVAGGEATCPRCEARFGIARHKTAAHWDELCNHCQTQVKIELKQL